MFLIYYMLSKAYMFEILKMMFENLLKNKTAFAVFIFFYKHFECGILLVRRLTIHFSVDAFCRRKPENVCCHFRYA